VARFLVFATPASLLVVGPGLAFPFVVPKVLAFRVLVAAAALALLAKLLQDREAPPRPGPIHVALAVTLLVSALSALLAPDPAISFGSTMERMDGLESALFLAAFAVLTGAVLKDGRDRRMLAAVLVGVAVLSSLLAALQAAGVPLLERPDEYGRVSSTAGQPAFLGALLSVGALTALSLAVTAGARRPRGAWLAVASWLALGTSLTGTRAALGALLAGGLVALAWILVVERRRLGLLTAAHALVVLAAMALLVRERQPDSEGGVLGRLLTWSTEDTTVSARLLVWRVAARAVVDRPVLGWGREGFSYALERHYEPELIRHETWFDRPHALLFDLLVEGGAAGLAAFLALAWTLARALRNHGRRGETTAREALFWALPALGWLVNRAVGVDCPETEVPFAAWIGIVLSLESRRVGPATEPPGATRLPAGLVAVALAALAINGQSTGRASWHLGSALDSRTGVSAPGRLALWDAALAVEGPGRFQAMERFTTALSLFPRGSPEARKLAIRIAADLEEVCRARPHNLRPRLLLLAALLRQREDGRPVDGRIRTLVGEIVGLAPRRPLVFFLGSEALGGGRPEDRTEAESLARHAVELLPDSEEAKVRLAVLLAAGPPSRSREAEISRLLDAVPEILPESVARVAGVYERNGRKDAADRLRSLQRRR
jgi:O-antigen ligase